MDKYFAKIIGIILLLIAISIVADLTQGIPAGGILNLITQFAPLNLKTISWAQIGSFFLAMFLLLFAIRVLCSKKKHANNRTLKTKSPLTKSREYMI